MMTNVGVCRPNETINPIERWRFLVLIRRISKNLHSFVLPAGTAKYGRKETGNTCLSKLLSQTSSIFIDGLNC